MTNKSKATIMGSSSENRSDLDFYETPLDVTKAFLDASGWQPKTNVIWEPAAGNGAIAFVVKDYFPGAMVVTSDIKTRALGLTMESDFLQHQWAEGKEFLQNKDIITNPPFSHAQQFVEKALELVNGDIVMLLRLAFLETTARRELFNKKHLREVWVSSKRIHFTSPYLAQREHETGKKSNSGMAMAWFIFNRNYTGDPVIKWI